MSALALLVQAGDAARSTAEGRLELWGGLSLADPWFLLLIPVCLLAVWHGRRRRAQARARVSALVAERPPRSLVQRLLWLPPALQAAGLVLAAVSLARPLRGDVEIRSVSEGVDIALVLDRSSSMSATDLDPAARETRLDVVKDVVFDFAERRMTDREGASDSVGLISFAKYPQQLCPFTLDVDAVHGFLEQVALVNEPQEDGTGIGIALAKAVEVLRETESKSKVAVLLTDGENNLDLIAPLEAARLAAEEGVRVYTVFAGKYVRDVFGRLLEVDRRIDTRELEAIAETTGGRFFRAKDRAGLEAAYAEIERLERSPREESRHVDNYELYSWTLLPALACYVASWLLSATWLRRLP